MADDNPLTVFVAENEAIAEVVLKLLAAEGIAADTFAPPPRTESDPLTGVSEMVTPDTIEVRVADAVAAEKAKELLASAMSAAALRAVREKRANRTGTVTAVCEDCGKSSDWPAWAMGTTETCPHCGQYMDVPDPDENWDGVDFGDAEAEDEGETEEGKK
jgi:hypothetical protein